MIIFPDISPEIFSISVFGLSFSVRWYALSYIVGILLAWRMALVALRIHHFTITTDEPRNISNPR